MGYQPRARPTPCGPPARSRLSLCTALQTCCVPPSLCTACRFRPSPEWLKMMEAVEAEVDAAVKQGTVLVESAESPGVAAAEPGLAAAAAATTAEQQGTAAGTRGAGTAAASEDGEAPGAAGAGDGQ